jgi:O-succinylbenzoic acid--CoA ligase
VFGLATVRPTIVRLEAWLPLRARTHANRPAIFADGRATSYARLEREAAATARRLAALGVGVGDRVATTLPAGADFAALLHAVPKLGAVVVPVNTRLSRADRCAQLGAAAPRLVVDEPPSGDQAAVELRAETASGDPWTMLFTSGTTGSPKPVVLSHGNHAASALASAWSLGVSPEDRWLCVLPLFHVGGLAILTRSAVYGTVADVHERFDADRAAAALAGGETTLVSLVPTMFRRILDAGLDAAPSLRAILLGGAAAPRDLLARAGELGLRVVRTYGMTETASQVATAPGERAGAQALPGAKLRIGDGDEVLVRGPMVARAAIGPDGWLHTGDRGRLDGDGLLHVLGRLDDVIVTGGEKVTASEVEGALLSHPAVAEAAVAGIPDADWGEVVTAWVVSAPGAESSAAELIEHCRARLAGFKLPKEVRFLPAMPRSPAGKVVRSRLLDSRRA